MIYLLTQMLLSLALAGVVGGAIGWLVQRHLANKNTNQMMETIHRQQQQATHAESEIAMLSDDFNELKQRNQREMDVLANEAKQVQPLKANLEKSQLLVKQMMQKHELRIKELSDENASLMHRIKDVTQREQVLDKIQADINNERRRGSSSAAGESVAAAVAATTGLMAADVSADNQQSSEQPENASFDFEEDAPDQKAETDQTLEDDKVVEVDEMDYDQSDELATSIEADADDDALDDTAPAANSEEELAPLFDPVDQHDDLKQIFGIGPVTEKTLNRLGITSYSQLAELKQHDIDKIAEALQISPARVERDNWVGSARRQLEEVLEGL